MNLREICIEKLRVREVTDTINQRKGYNFGISTKEEALRISAQVIRDSESFVLLGDTGEDFNHIVYIGDDEEIANLIEWALKKKGPLRKVRKHLHIK